MTRKKYDRLMETRIYYVAQFIVENEATVREAAKAYGISKSTVHKDMTERLPYVSYSLYKKVRKVLDFNKAERHIRGGRATALKYKKVS